MDGHRMLSDCAKALRQVVQAAFDAGGLDAICELIAGLIAPFEARIEELEKRLNMNISNSNKPLLADYARWISKGLKHHPEVVKPAGKRGRAKQSKEHNLPALSFQIFPNQKS